ncbi:hypothetical protein BK025_04030 [Sodalis sp. TME1]|nr:hypothetical protein BK025_04030 [Sodalis sp. TME1]
MRRDSAASGIDEEQAVSLPLADNHVSEFGQSVRELLQYQLDLINTAELALNTRNRAEGDELDSARRTGIGGYQRLESELNLSQLVKLTQEIFDAMTHLEQDRNATATELRTAGRLRNKLVSLIAGEYRRNGLSYCQAKRLAVGDYHDARITFLNNKSWKTLRHQLSHKAHTYVSTQRPAAEMKLGERDIFEESYEGKGICSADTVRVDHATNLWQSSLSVKEANGKEKMLFQGIRHGVLSPYGLPAGSPQRTSGALNRAKEVVAAALYSQNDLMTRALAGEEVPLRLVSTSLLTPTSVAGKEKAMLRDQMEAWQTLSNPLKQPLEIRVHDHEGNKQTVKVALSVAALNFGVNEAALQLGLGTSTSDTYNAPALAQLLGNDLRPEAEPGGWVGEYLGSAPANEPANARKVRDLCDQIKRIWAWKAHRSDDGEPYKAAQRIAMLAYEIGAVPCWNCKSGKDRTGMLDVELKREVIHYDTQQPLSHPTAPLNDAHRTLLQEVVMKSGNMEIQRCNTGVKGNKVFRKFTLPCFNLSLSRRIGLDALWFRAKGLSHLAKS